MTKSWMLEAFCVIYKNISLDTGYNKSVKGDDFMMPWRRKLVFTTFDAARQWIWRCQAGTEAKQYTVLCLCGEKG